MARSRKTAPRTPIVAAILALVALAATAVAAARTGRLRGLAAHLPGPLGAGDRPGTDDWRCTCGARYRVSGMDRHRVFWPAGAPESEPVLDGECVSCGRPLPA